MQKSDQPVMQHLRIIGAFVFSFCAMTLLAQDSLNTDRPRPTYFGITDGEVPQDPRDYGRGRSYDFPDWDVNAELPNDVFTFARLRYNSGTWMGRSQKWMIDYPDSDLNFAVGTTDTSNIFRIDCHPIIIDKVSGGGGNFQFRHFDLSSF